MNTYIKYSLLALAILGVIVLSVLEFDYFNRTLDIKWMILTSLLLGGGIGGWIGYRATRTLTDTVDKVRGILMPVVGLALAMPLLVSLSNRLLAHKAPDLVEVEFVTEQPFFSSRLGMIEGEKIRVTGYKVFFYLEGKLHWITSKSSMFPQKKRGDMVYMELQSGLWGFRYFPFPDLVEEKLI